MAGGQEGEVKLLSAWFSPYGGRAVLALHVKEVPFSYIEEDLGKKSQLLLESNPVYGKVPVLLHAGKAICESRVIIEYIDEVWPGRGSLLPLDPYARSQHRFWVDYIDKKLSSAWRLVLSTSGEEQGKAVEELIALLKPLDEALRELSGGKPFFNGDDMGYLDIVLACSTPILLAMEVLFNLEILDAAKLPHLNKWAEMVYEHPCVKKSFPEPNKVIEFITTLRQRFTS